MFKKDLRDEKGIRIILLGLESVILVSMFQNVNKVCFFEVIEIV